MSIKQNNKYGDNSLHYIDNSQHVNYFKTTINYNAGNSSDEDNESYYLILAGFGILVYCIFFPSLVEIFKKFNLFQYGTIIILSLISSISIFKKSNHQIKPLVISGLQSIVSLTVLFLTQNITIPKEVFDYCKLLKSDGAIKGLYSLMSSNPTQFSQNIIYILIYSAIVILFFTSFAMNFFKMTFKDTLLSIQTFIIPMILEIILIIIIYYLPELMNYLPIK